MPMKVKLSTQFVTLDKNKTEKALCLEGCVKGLFDCRGVSSFLIVMGEGGQVVRRRVAGDI